MRLGFYLGLRTIFGHPRGAFLSLLVLAAMLAPILVLWGLKSGTLTALVNELRNDPRNLEIRLIGDHPLGVAELAKIKGLEGVGFFQPTTRGLAARAWLSPASHGGREAISLLPGGEGDPLLPQNVAPPKLGETVISKRVADSLKVAIGDEVILRTQRESDRLTLAQKLRITGLIDAAQASGSQAIVNATLVEEVESFLDGFAIDRLELAGRPISERHLRHANLRLYAKQIEFVPKLAQSIEDLGYPVSSRAADVEKLVSIEKALNGIIAVVASLLIISYFGAASASILGVFDKHRRDIALLRLMGGSRATIFWFVAGFGLTTGLIGLLTAMGLYLGLADFINSRFSLGLASGAANCYLEPIQLVAAGLATMFLILIVTALSAWRFVTVAPGGALRAE
ncbi:ABC transporter permease [Bartonella sp. HY761]|uniref:ABC transporter permease n=1 Tax=Bartonella sp. HY761 TaxID=2979330 RepID=UPI0022025E1B|nr:FtsX-like permease family protein [Bartonella sp. HY761]UXN05865.1 FtsX-like permease family protein [Bartonella sp. HY761]